MVVTHDPPENRWDVLEDIIETMGKSVNSLITTRSYQRHASVIRKRLRDLREVSKKTRHESLERSKKIRVINAAAASAHAAEREAREAARGEDGIAQPPAPAADAEPPAAPADGAAAAAGSGSPAQGGDAGLGDGRAGGTERAGGTTPGEAGDPAPASGEVFAKPKAEEARQPGLPIASGGFGAGLPEAHQQLLGLFPGALGQMGSLAQLGMRPPLPGGLYFGGPAPLLQPPAGLWPPGGLPPSTSSGVGALAPAAGGLHILLQRPPTSAAGAASSIPQPVSPPAAPPAAPLPPPPRPPLVSPGGGPVTLSLADIIPTSSSVKP